MDNYENKEYQQEQTQQADATPETEHYPAEPVNFPDNQPYHGTGAGRRESPFASSPYVMNQQQPNRDTQSAYVPPVPPQEPPRKQKKKETRKVWRAVLCSALAVLLVASSCVITAVVINDQWQQRLFQMELDMESRLDQMQEQINAAANKQDTIVGYPQIAYTHTDPGAIYQNNVQSVVLVSATVTTSVFGQTSQGVSKGSGFVLTEDGYVVTNHHVVDEASSVSVTMYDGVVYDAKVVGSDETNDVGLLKIEQEVQLQPVTIGSSGALNVGDQVVAIGNPLGELTSTLTVGYVSAKERNVTTSGKTINMIQTDAAINSGNSGGPLFNSKGEVVGITTAKYSGASSSGATIEGIGFAIPIDDAMPLVDDLMNYGYINSAYLGVVVSNMDETTASYYGLPIGAYVQEVSAGFCAEKAGIQPKDIITAVGSHKVENISDLTKILRKFEAGDTTTITVFRSGQKLELTITLDEKPRETVEQVPQMPEGELPQNGSYEEWYDYFFGGKG